MDGKSHETMRKHCSSTRRNPSSFFSPDALLSIPPASLHLLEKLGVVTALALVDDELACEPFSTPQQLLVPSAEGGFSLLDICPVFEEGDQYSTDDEENGEHAATNDHDATPVLGSTTNRHRQGLDLLSSDDDDSDDDFNEVEARFNHSFSAPARALRKMRNYSNRRKKYVGGAGRRIQRSSIAIRATGDDGDHEDTGEDDIEVQFEDPQWWKHL